jgi:hypothetical protein
MIDDDERLARAAEAFFAGTLERERTAQPAPPRLSSQKHRMRSQEGGTGGVQDVSERREGSRRTTAPGSPAVILDREAWKDVVQREAARWQRHGGSVAVLAVRLARRRGAPTAAGQPGDEAAGSGDPQAAERYAVPLGDVLRHRARASDPVARVASDQFSVLLLEADEAGASAYAERIRSICEPWVTAVPGDLALRIGWAVPGLGGSIQIAAEDAFASVGTSAI